MSVAALLDELGAQLRTVPWLHTLRSPAPADQLARLPTGLRPLYEVTDGMSIHHIQFNGEVVGTAIEVLQAVEVGPIDQAMYGPRYESRQWIGQNWLAVARGSDSVFYIAMDVQADAFYNVNPIATDEVEMIAQSSEEFWEWLLDSLPNAQQLAAARQQGAA